MVIMLPCELQTAGAALGKLHLHSRIPQKLFGDHAVHLVVVHHQYGKDLPMHERAKQQSRCLCRQRLCFNQLCKNIRLIGIIIS